MHELGVTFSIMDTLENVAKENKVSHISKVVLELGEVSTVIPDYLIDCWNWAIKKRELFSDSQLDIKPLKAITFCENCNSEYPTVDNGKICPICGSDNTYLLRGNEFNILEIEAE